MMSIADSIKCGLPTFSPTAKYNRGDRFVYEGIVCEVTDVMDGEVETCRVYDQESGTWYWTLDPNADVKEFLEKMNEASRKLDVSVVDLDYNKSALLADDSITWREYPSSSRRRLVCEYCGCISDKDYGTCEHCGAVLTEPKSEDLYEVMKRWW